MLDDVRYKSISYFRKNLELCSVKHLVIFIDDVGIVHWHKTIIQQTPHHLGCYGVRILSDKSRHKDVGVNHCIHHAVCCFLRRSSLAARISALISSNVSSGSWLASANLRCCIYKSRALGVSVLSPLIVNGMLRLLITAFTKMLKAVLALMPNCAQSASNCDFMSDSNLTVTADCAISYRYLFFCYGGIMPPI